MRRRWMIFFALVWAAFSTACEKKVAQAVDVTAADGEDEVRAVIGSQGGTLRFPEGAVFVTPAGILQEEVTFSFRRNETLLDLPGKDVVDKAYSISPQVSFLPGAAKLSVPVKQALPGTLDEIKLALYCFGRKVSVTPQGELSNETWFPCPQANLEGRSQEGKYIDFSLFETTSHRASKPPFGFVQVAYDVIPSDQ